MTPASLDTQAADRLDIRVSQGRLRAKQVRAIAGAIAELHRSPERAPGDGPGDAPSPVGLIRRARSACEQLAERAMSIGLAPIGVDPIIASLAQRQRECLEWLLPRLERGGLRKRQGSLRCSRIWVDDDLKVRVDAGSDPASRVELIDIAEDLAGLFVDLSSRGADSAACTLLGEYAHIADDYTLFRVMGLYVPAAACELALSAIDAREGSSGEREGNARVEALVALALNPEPASQVDCVFAFGGGVASGKSTLAREFADSIGAVRVGTDAVRDSLLEHPPGIPVHELEWTLAFAPGFEKRVYESVYQRAEAALATGHTVVFDGCFASAVRRVGAAELAARYGASFVFIECRADAETVKARLEARDERDRAPEGWEQLAGALAARWEARTADEPGMHAVVDTSQPVRESLDSLRAQIDAGDPSSGE